MVFYYTIRGGQCLNAHSHIHLSPSDIICYVGRDKHENEHLIKYGWPGDIWFHVDGLSSAHVYFRLKNTDTVSSIPLDDLPPDSVYDMMQICKNNSIAGCKLASCKMVYTPHSNLKKTFDMESGAVTYHNTKLCRYGRCDKDRQRVKELEKTKTADLQVDYYEEMKANERRIIERKKRARRLQDDQLYDPIRDDVKAMEVKATRQGDKASGLDSGLAALEGLSFAPVETTSSKNEAATEQDENNEPEDPLWMREQDDRMLEPSEDIRFLRERGYDASEATAAWDATKSRIKALKKLYLNDTEANGDPSDIDIPEEVKEVRQEEKEVLLAMFGGFDEEEDEQGTTFSNAEDENMLDACLPITAYEAPERYESPPPLVLEIYVDNNIAPLYPNEPPVLALTGGGLPEVRLRELTKRLQAEAARLIEEEPGAPQIFNLITFIGEEAENVIQEEAAELEAERKKRIEEAKAAAALRRDAEAAISEKEAAEHRAKGDGGTFTSEAERRAYAKDIVAKGAYAKVESDGKKTKGRKEYKTGVSDQSLINDLFG